MPGLESDMVGVILREGEVKSELGSLCLEPGECGCHGKGILKRRLAGRSDVDCAAGVVLAVTGGGDQAQDVFDLLAAIQLSADDFDLAGDTSKTRQGQELNIGLCGRRPHPLPCGCGGL